MPILIAHRGNFKGPNSKLENKPSYVIDALNKKYHVEIDVWYDNGWYLGHDDPKYKVDFSWLHIHGTTDEEYFLWIHCKNVEALSMMSEKCSNNIPYFWHQNDDYTLTSNGIIWAYPNKQLTKKCIAVLPETADYTLADLRKCYGICSDYVYDYQKKYDMRLFN